MNANFEKHILQTAIASNISGYAIGLKDNDPLKTIFTHLAQRLLTMKPDIFAYMKILDELNHLNVSTKSTKLFSNRTMTFKDRLLKKTKKVYSSIHSEALPTSTSGDDKEYMDALKKPISIEKNHHLAELTSLYAKLYELAGFKWVHTYKQDKTRQIMNDTIHDWQEKMMIPTRGSSIGDFQRNFLIDGIKGYSEEPKEHIQQRLSTLIAKASAYPHDDNNTAEEALLKWMTANTGAQDNVNVATLLFTNEEFSQTPLLLFDTETQYANWSIQDGRVALQFALEIPTLIDPNNGMYHIKLSNGTEIQFNDLTEKIVGADTYQSLKKNDRLQPVATVRGTIALEYNAQAKNKITPVVSALQVSSQTSVLNEPNQQLSRRFKL